MALKPMTHFNGLRLTRDPELAKNIDTALVNVSVAFTEKYKKKCGEQVEVTHYYDLEFWSHKAEYLMKYGHKGASIDAVCFPHMSTWENEQKEKRSRIAFRVEEFAFVQTKTMGSTGQKPQGDAGMGTPPDEEEPF